jgi:hypothetical protein
MSCLPPGREARPPGRRGRGPTGEGTIGAALAIRDDPTPEAPRRYARHEPNRRAALRMLAIANAPEGMSRTEAAKLAGMERQPSCCSMIRLSVRWTRLND